MPAAHSHSYLFKVKVCLSPRQGPAQCQTWRKPSICELNICGKNPHPSRDAESTPVPVSWLLPVTRPQVHTTYLVHSFILGCPLSLPGPLIESENRIPIRGLGGTEVNGRKQIPHSAVVTGILMDTWRAGRRKSGREVLRKC